VIGELENMPLFTVNSGAPDIDDGVYPVVLTKIDGPKSIYPQSGPNAGEEVKIFEWTFSIVAPGTKEDGAELTASSSMSSGPRSKMYAWLTALLNGKAPQIGASFEAKDLVGKSALATIRKDDSGWPKIDNLGAMPASMQQASFARATGAPIAAEGSPAPAAATDAPLRETVAAGAAEGNLPF
jgi:hypothetical protein